MERNLWEKAKESLFRDSKERIEQDLETIDFDLLRTIFEEIYKKSGLEVKDMDFVKREDIEFFNDIFYAAANAGSEPVLDEVTGEEIGERPALRFNPANYKFVVPFLKQRMGKKLLTLKLLIHEQVHVTQINGYEEFEDENGEPEFGYVFGLTRSDNYLEGTRTAFNEGLVEKIADTLLEEYLIRSGNSVLIQGGYYKVYDIGRMLIDLLIHKISVYSGVPEGQVFNALVRASYDGQDIADDTLFVDGGEEIRAFIEDHQYLAPNSVYVPFRNEISARDKKKLKTLFLKEIDIKTYTDKHVLQFLKK
jgi:hypothetical protein